MVDESKSANDDKARDLGGAEEPVEKDSSSVTSGRPFQSAAKPSGSLADAQQQRYLNRALNRATATNIPAFAAEELDSIGQKAGDESAPKDHFDKARATSNMVSRPSSEPSYYQQHPYISVSVVICAIAIPSFLYTYFAQKDVRQRQLISAADSKMQATIKGGRPLKPTQGQGFGVFYMNRADMEIYGHKYALALKDLKTAMERDPDHKVQYLNKMAEVFLLLKDMKGVAAASGAALVFDPNNVTALLQHGKANYVMGNKLTAKDDFYKAVQLAPKDASTFLARADFLYAEKQMLSAEADYQQSLALNDLQPGVKQRLASIQAIQMRKIKQAQSQSPLVSDDDTSDKPTFSKSESQSLQIKNVEKLRQIGYTALSHRKFAFALAALRQCVILNPNDAPSRKLLAYALLSSGDASGAFDQFNAWDTLVGAGLEEQLTFAKALAKADDSQTLASFLDYIVDSHATSANALIRIAQIADRAGCSAAVEKATNLGLKLSAGPLRYQFLVEMRRVQTHKIEEDAETRKTGKGPETVASPGSGKLLNY